MSDYSQAIPPQTTSSQPICPNCKQPVAYGVRFCPKCGSQLMTAPPMSYGPPIMSMPEQKHHAEKRLAIAIVLVVLALTGVGGFIFYSTVLNGNGGVLQAAAAATDKSGASNAVDGLQITCTTTSTDTSGLPYSASIYLTFGVSNPSKYQIESTWTITYDYAAAGVVLTTSQTFHVPAQGVAYPRWQLTMTSGQLSSLGSSSNPSFTVSLDRTFIVHGSYGTYDFTRHDTYNSASGVSSGTSSTGSTGNLPAC